MNSEKWSEVTGDDRIFVAHSYQLLETDVLFARGNVFVVISGDEEFKNKLKSALDKN